MDILPAIDLLDGNVVRLAQGRRDQVTVYSDDPVAIALKWKEAGARWLCAASLDRYLRSIGKPQIYGTQFGPDAKHSQEPFNRDLISDPLRGQLGVPPLAAQREQFEELSTRGR